MDKKIKLLSTRQVSEYLGLSIRTVQRLSEQGKIKTVKLGSYWKYSEDDIKKYFIFGTNFSKEPARKPNNPTERRAHPRINSNFKCEYSIDLQPFKYINNEGIIKNLSAGGIFLFSQKEAINKTEADDPIKLAFILDSDPKQINTIGKVIRKTDLGLGIKFKNLDEDFQKRITAYAS